MSPLRNLFLTAMLMPLLAGCVQTPVKETVDSPARVEAQRLMTDGRYLEAAAAFNELAAAASTPQREDYQLRAADALLHAGDLVGARNIASNVKVDGLSNDLRTSRGLLLAGIELEEGHPARVLELLPARSAPQDPERLGRFHLLRGQAFEQLGQYLDGARERIVADRYLSGEPAEKNRHATWTALARAPLDQLSSVDTSSPANFEGWVTLALIARRLITDPTVFEQAVDQWALRHAGHPAGGSILADLKAASLLEAEPPKHVALLLPLDGPFARAARAIRDGFLAAWFQGSPASRPEVSIWNTAGQETVSVYAAAVAEGADFVVGPLDKPSVRALADAGPPAVDTLVLNVLDEPPARESTDASATEGAPATSTAVAGSDEASGILYQYALSPEEEAQRVAEHAWSQGFDSAAVVTPAGAWGQRVSNAFSDAWRELGGQIADLQAYEDNTRDFSEPVSNLLAVNQSKERAKTLRRYLGVELEHTPRRRQDIDFVFVVANPNQARLLRPQLKFHHGSDLPVFATSHVYAGVSNPGLDIDVDDIEFGDMPWVLKPGGASGTLRVSTENAWQDAFAQYIRFYAFGADAYAILPYLGTLRAQPFIEFPGETGSLSVNADSRIRRGLTWAKFVEGVPRIVESGALEEE